jgi:hypothetical protein
LEQKALVGRTEPGDGKAPGGVQGLRQAQVLAVAPVDECGESALRQPWGKESGGGAEILEPAQAQAHAQEGEQPAGRLPENRLPAVDALHGDPLPLELARDRLPELEGAREHGEIAKAAGCPLRLREKFRPRLMEPGGADGLPDFAGDRPRLLAFIPELPDPQGRFGAWGLSGFAVSGGLAAEQAACGGDDLGVGAEIALERAVLRLGLFLQKIAEVNGG